MTILYIFWFFKSPFHFVLTILSLPTLFSFPQSHTCSLYLYCMVLLLRHHIVCILKYDQPVNIIMCSNRWWCETAPVQVDDEQSGLLSHWMMWKQSALNWRDVKPYLRVHIQSSFRRVRWIVIKHFIKHVKWPIKLNKGRKWVKQLFHCVWLADFLHSPDNIWVKQLLHCVWLADFRHTDMLCSGTVSIARRYWGLTRLLYTGRL